MEKIEEDDWSKAWNETESISINSSYQVGDELGHGAVGRVFRGLNMRTGEVVAIKQIEKQRISRETLPSIMAELDILQQLFHPNVVQFIEYQETQEYLYFVMEFVEGGSLYATMKRFGNFSERLLVLFITQVLRGLRYLHSKGVVHRDIKGANILLSKEGQCKLTDFGSCTYEVVKSKESMVGTPFWMSPEMIEGSGCSFPADIWSLGCTIIELLTGKPPFWDYGPELALFKMMNMPTPPIPKKISKTLEDFLMKCFQRNPEDRWSAIQLLNHPWITNIWGETYEEQNTPVKEKEKKKNLFKRSKSPNPGGKHVRSSSSTSLTSSRRSSVSSTLSPPGSDRDRERGGDKVERGEREKGERGGDNTDFISKNRGRSVTSVSGIKRKPTSQNEQINLIIEKISAIVIRIEDDVLVPEGLIDFSDTGKTAVPLFFLQQEIRSLIDQTISEKKGLMTENEELKKEEHTHSSEHGTVYSEHEFYSSAAHKLSEAKKSLQNYKKTIKKDKISRDRIRENLQEMMKFVQSLDDRSSLTVKMITSLQFENLSPRRATISTSTSQSLSSPKKPSPKKPISPSNSHSNAAILNFTTTTTTTTSSGLFNSISEMDSINSISHPKRTRFDEEESENTPVHTSNLSASPPSSSDKSSFRTRSLLFKSATKLKGDFNPILQSTGTSDVLFVQSWLQPGSLVEVRTMNIWNDAVIMSSSRSGRYHVIMIGSGLEDDVKLQNIREKPELKRVESAKLRRNISQTMAHTISQWRQTTNKTNDPSIQNGSTTQTQNRNQNS